MKKCIAGCLLLGLLFTASGCALGDLVERITDTSGQDSSETNEIKERVYIDEIRGILSNFTGSTISLTLDEQTYTFDVSEATLERTEGMICGDEISVIYEGQLPDTGTDTSTVTVLKVVDVYHKTQELAENTAKGTLQDISANTISILNADNELVTYPITGTEEYFQNGIHKDAEVYIHYYGATLSSDAAHASYASQCKVLSISDIEPMKLPSKKTKDTTSLPDQLRATILRRSLDTLTVQLEDGTSVDLNISNVPCHFPGGAASGAPLTISYTGSLSEHAESALVSITGDDPSRLKENKLTYKASGMIIARTKNTVTIRTPDDAELTLNTDSAANLTRGGMEIGDDITFTFDPSENKYTNIYSCLTIQDSAPAS